MKRQIRVGKTGGKSPSDIILMGEKKSTEPDYYMELKKDGTSDFWTKVEKYRHGLQLGSNYLMCDGSVTAKQPQEAEKAMDPWDPVTGPIIPVNPPPTTTKK
jgi:prepilin-type processing-associated H-X9-DG protein